MSIDATATAELQDDLLGFLKEYYKEDILELANGFPKDQRSLVIDWWDLYVFDHDIADDLLVRPDLVTSEIEAALATYDVPIPVNFSNANVRVKGLSDEETHDIGGFSPSERDGHMIGITGQVSKRTDVAPTPKEIAYECQMCGSITRVPQDADPFQEPHECSGCERQGPFVENRHKSEKEDYQKVLLEQPPEKTNGEGGQTIEVRFRDDAVGGMDVGDRVTIVGRFVLDRPSDNSDQVTYDVAVEGSTVQVNQTDFEEIEVTDELLEIIEEIAAGEHGDPFDLLVGSIAPALQEMDDIKEALVLSMFGGVRTEHGDGTATRGDIHILMIGDPGTGKTTLLEAIAEIAPRSVRASGKGASESGMTAAAVRDEFSDGQQWTLDAGALVVANKGVATIDELDKLNEGVEEALHDAMGEQKVSVNKAGINTTLPTQTTVVAAGNPKYGRFDRHEPIAQQVEIGPTLFSRFDLSFTLEDRPDEERDRQIARAKVNSKERAKQQSDGGSNDLAISEVVDGEHDAIEVLRAYIAHAKREVDPVIEDEAVRQKIEDSYTMLRLANATEDSPVPVTARKLDAFQRLAEASARIRLSETVDIEDVHRAKRLIGSCLRDVGIDEETGQFDADLVEAESSTNQRRRIKTLLSIIDGVQRQHDDYKAPKKDVLERAMDELDVGESRVENDIAELKKKGEVVHYQSDDSLRHIT